MDNLPTIPTNKPNFDIVTAETLPLATSYLSQLNKSLDTLTAHKEAKTKPINEALKKIRADYKPLEEQLTNAIQEVKQQITAYANNEAKRLQEEQQKILADKRTTLDTKMNKLATIEQAPTKAKTDQGSITFVTVKKYRIIDLDAIPRAFLIPNDEAIKQAMKESSPIAGIEFYEEQSVRNYR